MGIIGWIILGGLAGWLASVLMGESSGILKNVIVGIVGAFIGGAIFSMLGGSDINGFNLYSFLVALIGAIILILLMRLISGGTHHRA